MPIQGVLGRTWERIAGPPAVEVSLWDEVRKAQGEDDMRGSAIADVLAAFLGFMEIGGRWRGGE